MPSPAPPTTAIENIYGHGKRLDWIIHHLEPGHSILEIGCGTGAMIVLPLLQAGFNIHGVDLDAQSITYGQRLFQQLGQPSDRLSTADLSTLPAYDVVILSEVLEHNSDDQINDLLQKVLPCVKPGGQLLVTVPNGYGWFELEAFLWNRCRIGRLLQLSRIEGILHGLKYRLLGPNLDFPYPSTLNHSPHVQRFTLTSIRRRLQQHGWVVEQATGSVLMAGQFSHLFWTGIKPIMRFNGALGRCIPAMASGFYLACRKPR